jgi:hypothetical protein
MRQLPTSGSDHRNEFLAQCDQDKLAKARAGDAMAKDELQKEYEAYRKAKDDEADLDGKVTGAANLAEFRADPKKAIAELQAQGGSSLYVHELAEAYGLFRVVSEQWSRDAGAQFGKGTDWGGKVATKGWKATIEISDRRYEVRGSSYYDKPRRHEAVTAEAWKVLLGTVGEQA